jgi:Icc-related predicted phosphoesterase
VRIAAAGDLHCEGAESSSRLAGALAAAAERVDLILLAGDLTEAGEPHQASVVADACRRLHVPVVAVLGNHESHADRRDEVLAVLRDAGIVVLEAGHHVLELAGTTVGVVGATGFTGGFHGTRALHAHWPGRRRQLAEGARQLASVDAGLRAVAGCAIRIVLLHYAPTAQTLVGERRELWDVLGAEQLAAPIVAHSPDLVLHAHAHAGSPAGEVGGVLVYNVSLPLLGDEFRIFELPL